jgi:hypothetical protein
VQNIKYKSADQPIQKRAKMYPTRVLPAVPVRLEKTHFQKFMPVQDYLCKVVERIV